ncbi:MAG: hypothetical protein K9L32_00395 [Chromatiaceae bacterium]|nr:hypothetical protein [Chromatiaceae bacterium]MCF8002664.1 hypothetical protein [Chromatiaceae bacterium]
MTESKLTQAQKRHEQADEELAALLEQGADAEQTTKARAKLSAAENALRKAKQDEGEQQKKLEDGQIKAAESLVDELSKEIGATMQRIIASVSTPDAPRIATGQAQAILKARSEAAQAAEVLSQAKDRLDHLEARHSELSQRWDNITKRRAQGDTHDDDTAQLVVIGADREGVERLIEKAQAEVQRADLDHARAAEALKSAERRWAGVTREVWRLAMQKVAAPMEAGIAKAADEIRAHPGHNGEQAKGYEPTDPSLRDHLHRTGWTPYLQHRAA